MAALDRQETGPEHTRDVQLSGFPGGPDWPFRRDSLAAMVERLRQLARQAADADRRTSTDVPSTPSIPNKMTEAPGQAEHGIATNKPNPPAEYEMQPTLDPKLMKNAFKDALVEVLHEQRDTLREVLAEVLEDSALAEAVRQGPDSKLVIDQFRKLSGAPGYYRIRVGDYRIGLAEWEDGLECVRCLHRRDIYRYFP